MHPHFYGAMKLSQASYDFISRSLMPAAADERCADANIFTSARNTIRIHRRLQRTGILSYHRQQMRFRTRRHASMDASTSSTFMDASARKRTHICAGVRECVHSTSVCIHRRIHENVLARTALLPGLSAPLPITLPSVRRKGAGEKLAVTLVPRTSSGPIRQLKLNVCALSASSNRYKGLQQSECY